MKKHVSTLVCLFTVYLILQTFKVFAQTSQPQNTPRPGSSYTPHSSGTCSEPLPFGNTAPEPYCQPGYTANDTFPYIVPCKDVTDRNTCRIRDGAAIGNGFDWHNVDSINYKSGNYVIQTSNQKSLLYEVRGNEIFFIQDTTWSNSTQCSNGKPAFQRINERNGMLWATRSLSCAANNSYSSQGTNAGFEYSESQEESLRLLPDNVTPCSAPHTGDVSGRKHLIFNGNAKCGSFSGDILVIRNMEGAGAGEVFIYCKDVGLCGWYQNINFSDPENNPRNWVGKDICANTAFGHDYGSCYVDCHPEGINQPVPLSVSQQIQIQTARSLNINLLNLQPADGNHKIAIKEQRHLDGVLRSMLPDTYKIQKKGETQPILQNNQKLIKLNQNNVDVTIRSNIKVHGDQIIITGNATDQNSIQITTQGSTQLATSEDILWNNKDCEDCRE
ncbi:MAG: hypothetical protein N3A54_06820, partial [Patescibacteria group bacterium]|nr:hypothetical protein [Patescibacteria group bacterium]